MALLKELHQLNEATQNITVVLDVADEEATTRTKVDASLAQLIGKLPVKHKVLTYGRQSTQGWPQVEFTGPKDAIKRLLKKGGWDDDISTYLKEGVRSKASIESFDNSHPEWKKGYNDYVNGQKWTFPTSLLKTPAGKKYRAGWDEAEKAAKRKAEIKAVAPSASSLRADIVKKLKTLGFKLHSQEQSPGALKAWLESDKVVGMTAIANLLPFAKLRRKSYGDEVIDGKGYEVEKQGPKSVYVAVYRKGSAGQEYEMGIDT
jgi:hypothetical protein